MKRGQSGLSGVLLIDKPGGMTSHDVVNRVRRVTGERRVGHAGTLDPLATGLLVVLVGPATRLEPYLSSATKSYEATIRFGFETDTDDADGEPTTTSPLPDWIFSADKAREVLESFIGPQEQLPPKFSAIKVEGKVAHRVARGGGEPELTKREVTVYDAALLATEAAERTWRVAFEVSKGTYIRALARDIGRHVGSGAHLCSLRRTGAGALSLVDACTLGELEAGMSGAQVAGRFIDPVAALGLQLVDAGADSVADGRPIAGCSDATGEGELVAVGDPNSLRALYRRRGEVLVAEVVFATPVARAS